MISRQLDEEVIFHTARKITNSEAREEYLEQVCGDNTALLTRVRALLEVHEQEQDFLRSAGPEATATLDAEPITEAPGTEIGRYRLMEQIGEGGMGVVFVAEQRQPLRRKVALKVIKPGMDSKAVVARFEAERQALALMDHPNIAHVLDAGTTERGRPFFVMELIRGIPITEYCDANRLSIPERLELFMQVCKAVQHAHQKGIIHRDIKPTNVLITLHDGMPVPKVIDFGIAKALNQKLTEKTIYTQIHQAIGTLAYMSPEQAELSGLDVDTRADVYGLGVLLYELLTGTPPFEQQRLHRAAYHEACRIIRDEEPPRPSTRLSTLGETASAVSTNRRSDLAKLGAIFRGELDWIVMKALEKDRTRRYETASGFATDIQRYLSDEPVEAKPPTPGYRFGKFFRRNKGPVLAASLLALTLVGGITGTSLALRLAWSAVLEAEKARKIADDRAIALHGIAIEKALNFAVVGNLQGVSKTLAEYEEIIEPNDRWLDILKAAAHVHCGNNLEAIKILTPVVDASSDNVAAAGLLAVAHWHEGHWEEGVVRANQVRNMEPREEFYYFDLLFKGYALFFLDYGLSTRTFEEVIEQNPTWGIARSYRAITLALHTENKDHLEDIADDLNEALKQINIAQSLAVEENPWTLLVRLFVEYKIYDLYERHDLSPKRIEETLSNALDLAARMQRDYPSYIPGIWVSALLYRDSDQKQKADEMWERLLNDRSPLYAFSAIGYYYSHHATTETLDRIEKIDWPDPMIRAGKTLVLADMPNHRGEALELCHSLLSDARSNWTCYVAVQGYLLLGEADLARDGASKWLQYAKNTEDVTGVNRALRLIANHDGSQSLTNDVGQLPRFFQEYSLGLIELSHGNRDKARQHFETCVEMDVTASVTWAEAFVKRLKADSQWPRGNVRVTTAP
jgi:serine/threonine protein kinase/tetratricopeptide (TPR) repeat protein